MIRLLAATAVLALAGTAAVQADPVSFDFDKNHTTIRASWLHQGYSTQSLHFTDYEGTLDLDLENPSASTVDVTFTLPGGIWAGADQDRFIGHLNSDDFFGTQANPTAHFVATGFETEDGTTGTMTGDLTMNGVTNPVTLDVTLNQVGETQDGNTKAGFTATGSILRSEWDMGYAVPFVSDEIELFISTELVAAAAE